MTRPALIFSTPRPVQTEEALTGGYRNVPIVFPGIEKYHPIQARTTFTSGLTATATGITDAIPSVVQILRCDDFGCDTPVGSGVIVHPSGLILTAYHALLQNPNNLRSREYEAFVIAIAEGSRTSPLPRYRASVVADRDELDVALLAIDGDMDEEPINPADLNLPALPFANVDTLFDDRLVVLGYPGSGDFISREPTEFIRFGDGGREIVVDDPLEPGFSGGPALVSQDGRLAIAGLVFRRRTTSGGLDQEGLLRAIDQVSEMTWSPDVARAAGREVKAIQRSVDGEDVLELSINLTTFDRFGDNLRLLFYAVERESGQPWQPDGADAPLAIWTNLTPRDFIDVRDLRLTVPLAQLGISPERLTFYALLWDRQNGESIWASDRGSTGQVDLLAAPTLTLSPTATRRPTAMPPPRPTADATTTASAIETAVAATLEALNPPTPTPNLIIMRLTEVAKETATARSWTPTATPRPTATKTARPTSTRTSTPTRTWTPTPVRTESFDRPFKPVVEEIMLTSPQAGDGSMIVVSRLSVREAVTVTLHLDDGQVPAQPPIVAHQIDSGTHEDMVIPIPEAYQPVDDTIYWLQVYDWDTLPSIAISLTLSLDPTLVEITAEELHVSQNVCFVQVDGLNLRSGPAVTYAPPIDSLALNSVLIPLSRNASGTWIEIKVVDTGDKGWVSSAERYVYCLVAISELPIAIIPPTPTVSSSRDDARPGDKKES